MTDPLAVLRELVEAATSQQRITSTSLAHNTGCGLFSEGVETCNCIIAKIEAARGVLSGMEIVGSLKPEYMHEKPYPLIAFKEP